MPQLPPSTSPRRMPVLDKGKTTARGYGWDWQKVRARKLRLDPICQIGTHCDRDVRATEVDHIKPIADRPDLRLDIDNLQSACRDCHRAKTLRDNEVVR